MTTGRFEQKRGFEKNQDQREKRILNEEKMLIQRRNLGRKGKSERKT